MLLKVNVRDEAGEKVPCRLALRRLDGNNNHELQQTVCCEGEYIFAVPQGHYEVEATRGRMYTPAVGTVRSCSESAGVDLCLSRVFDPKALGLYSFDAHSHVSREDDSSFGSLGMAALVMKCEDFNFFFAGSPYDTDVHYQYLSGRFTDECSYREKYASLIRQVQSQDFILDIGNEIVKCRYGHAFLMNYDQYPPFSLYYDRQFDPWLFTKEGPEPGYDISYMHEALLRERTAESAAVAAHPTSWWWHGNGQFITNIASTIGFEVLAGSIDAMVVLGYQPDTPWYQNLWFDLLNNGYFLPGIAETDTAFDNMPGDKLRFKTYAWLDDFTVDSLCRAVRAGRCVASSGPIITMKVEGELPGSVLRFEPGQAFTVDLECLACCEGSISRVQIIVNGEIASEYSMQQDRVAVQHILTVEKSSYILAKCYDIAGNTAIVNPVYIRNGPFVNENYRAAVRIKAVAGHRPASGWYWLDDGPRCAFEGSFSVRMRPASELHIEAEGQIKTIKLFELPELQYIFKNLYFGLFNDDRQYEPGQVPANAFQVQRIRELLDNVNLTVDFAQGQ